MCFAAALVTAGVLVLADPSFVASALHFLNDRDRYITGSVLLLGGIVGPIALVWCVACLKASGRRSFYYDSLLEQMVGGDSLEEHYTVEGQEHAMNGTILFIGGTAPCVLFAGVLLSERASGATF